MCFSIRLVGFNDPDYEKVETILVWAFIVSLHSVDGLIKFSNVQIYLTELILLS